MKIGFTSFGGISMVPLINNEMISHGWMTAEEVTDILAIAEDDPRAQRLQLRHLCRSADGGDPPGPWRPIWGAAAGPSPWGALAAKGYESFGKSPDAAGDDRGAPRQRGDDPGPHRLPLHGELRRRGGGSPPRGGAGGAGSVLLLLKCKVSIPAVIGISAAGGLLLFGVLGL